MRGYVAVPCITALVFCAASPVAAQDSTAVATPPPAAPRGSQLLLPLGSVIVPGLGQYVEGAPLAGVAYTGTAVAAALLAVDADGAGMLAGTLPREGRDQLTYEALHFAQSAGFLSGWDAFRRAVPALQREGKYRFLKADNHLGELLTAPFDARFLRRPTTLVELAYTGLVAALVAGGRDPGVAYEPFHARDAAFATSLALNAGVTEEALFRGWLLPVLQQTTGGQFWLANALQAGAFGSLHASQSGAFSAVIAGWALYEGWLTRRNDWSVRESIFQHFWYDGVVVATEFLVDERQPRIQLTFPTIRF